MTLPDVPSQCLYVMTAGLYYMAIRPGGPARARERIPMVMVAKNLSALLVLGIIGSTDWDRLLTHGMNVAVGIWLWWNDAHDEY